MRQQYEVMPMTKRTQALVGILNAIIGEYSPLGLVLTVRQLFYQMVARGLIKNTEQTYKKICWTVNKAKLAGLIDWGAIEDRTRAFRGKQRWATASEIMGAAVNGFHMDMWRLQPVRVYAVIEKEALSSVFSPVCREFDVPLLAARGYPSGSVLREFAQNYMLPYEDQECVLLHFGDHDPSGMDMSRDLEERLTLFGEHVKMDFRRIALNMPQIEELKPPPNPAKVTDSRWAAYVRKFGHYSYELDALDPRYLQQLFREEVVKYINQEGWDEQKIIVEKKRARLKMVHKLFLRG